MHDKRIYNIVTSKQDPNHPDKKYWNQHGILMIGLTDNGEQRITIKLNSLPIGEFNGWFSVYPKEDDPNRSSTRNLTTVTNTMTAYPFNQRGNPMKLYEITHEYRHALAVINEADLSDLNPDEQQQLITDTLDPFETEFQTKALAIGAFVANLDLEAKALKTMEQRINQRRKANERKAQWLTDYLHVNMEVMKLTTIKDNQISLSLRKNPPKVIINNETLVPDDYKETQTTILIRKTLIAEALKQGKAVPGAVLMNGTRLQIR